MEKKNVFIKDVPILRPSIKEFNDFEEYVNKVQKIYKNDYGIAKVVKFRLLD